MQRFQPVAVRVCPLKDPSNLQMADIGAGEGMAGSSIIHETEIEAMNRLAYLMKVSYQRHNQVSHHNSH